MANFRLNRKYRLYIEIRRIGEELFSEIRGVMASPSRNKANAVHAARKSIKKLGALLYILRNAASIKSVTGLERDIQCLARQLAGVRDSVVMLQTLNTLLDEYSPYIKVALGKNLRAGLKQRYESALLAAYDTSRVAVFLEKLAIVETRFYQLLSALEDANHTLLGKALDDSYRGSRKRWKRARHRRNPKNFHKWRKKVKLHWYLVRLIMDWDTERFGGLAVQLDDLGELLGLDHDLSVLQKFMLKHQDMCGSSKQAALISAMASIKQQVLQEDALVRSRSVYAKQPREFRRWIQPVVPLT